MSLQDEGKVRMIGVSNTYDVRILQALSDVRKVQVVQNRWYEDNGWDKSVFDYCRSNDVQYQYDLDLVMLFTLTFVCALHRSFWTLSGSPSLLTHPSVLAIAQAAKITTAQVVFGLAQSMGVVPLSGTTSEVHMKEDVSVGPDVLAADEVSVKDVKRWCGWDTAV